MLKYAEIPYRVLYDEKILQDSLVRYDWIHLHHEDFTGQYGRFWLQFNSATWYKIQVATDEAMASKLGFKKVSTMKLAVAKKLNAFVAGGGFMFAMCSATDSYDIALAAEGLDICDRMYDGDGFDQNMNLKQIQHNTNFQILTPMKQEYKKVLLKPMIIFRYSSFLLNGIPFQRCCVKIIRILLKDSGARLLAMKKQK